MGPTRHGVDICGDSMGGPSMATLQTYMTMRSVSGFTKLTGAAHFVQDISC